MKSKPSLRFGSRNSNNSEPDGKKNNRRVFCAQMAASLTMPLLAAEKLSGKSVNPDTPQPVKDESYWTNVRSHFLLEPGCVYFNNASIGLPPKPVIERVDRGYRRLAENPIQARSELYEEVEREVRPTLARLVGSDPSEIALTRGASEGLHLMANGISLERGDEVITTSQEHSAGLTPWLVRAERSGIVVKQVEVPSPFEGADQVVHLLEGALSQRTKAISFCHITRGGWLFPVQEICQMARRHGILSLVDGAQAIGMVSANLHELGCDLYASSLHKWMLAPSGSGMLYVRNEAKPQFSSLFVLSSQTFANASRYEMIGSLPIPVRVGAGSAAEFVERIGIQDIERRNRSLSTYLRDQLAQLPRVRMLGSVSSPACSPGITLFEVQGMPATSLQAAILDRFRINVDEHVRNGHNAIRVSTHFYNTQSEIDSLIRALDELIAKS